MMCRIKMIALLMAIALPGVFPQEKLAPPAKRNVTMDDLFRIKRVGSPQVSPDGNG